MAIYRSGKASIDAAGKITGNGTKWADPLNMITRESTIVFYDNGTLRAASILDIESDTSMTSVNGDGVAVAETDYFILVNDATSIGGLSKQVSEALRYFQGKESTLQEFIDWIENFDWAKLQRLHDEVEQYAGEAKVSADLAEQRANAASASQIASAGSEANAKSSETESARLEALSRTHAQDASGFKDEAMTQAERAKGYADSVKPETYLTKDGNLSGLTSVSAARSNLGVASAADIDLTYLRKDSNLSDVKDKKAAASNLNLGENSDAAFLSISINGLKISTSRNADFATIRRPTLATSDGTWMENSSFISPRYTSSTPGANGVGFFSGESIQNGLSTKITLGCVNGIEQNGIGAIHMSYNGANSYRRFQFYSSGYLQCHASSDLGSGYDFAKNPISDRTLKEDISYNDGADCYERIKKLKPCTFRYKSKSRSDSLKRGFIAQDLNDIDHQYTLLIDNPLSDDDSVLAIDSNVLLLDATAALKAAIDKIEALTLEVEIMKEKLNS